ncbi:hypothetical protein HanIR_Chr01g0027351 [Helianthus annuus]|nr:hypothetical protein HanIR_Chr01g0027351 [Helianthus annuus]
MILRLKKPTAVTGNKKKSSLVAWAVRPVSGFTVFGPTRPEPVSS